MNRGFLLSVIVNDNNHRRQVIANRNIWIKLETCGRFRLVYLTKLVKTIVSHPNVIGIESKAQLMILSLLQKLSVKSRNPHPTKQENYNRHDMPTLIRIETLLIIHHRITITTSQKSLKNQCRFRMMKS